MIGFDSGDILIYSPVSGKHARFNKDGAFNAHRVCSIAWIPASENVFAVGFEDGALLFFDKLLEDASGSPTAISGSFIQEYDSQKTFLTNRTEFCILGQWNPKKNPVASWKVGEKSISSKPFSSTH